MDILLLLAVAVIAFFSGAYVGNKYGASFLKEVTTELTAVKAKIAELEKTLEGKK